MNPEILALQDESAIAALREGMNSKLGHKLGQYIRLGETIFLNIQGGSVDWEPMLDAAGISTQQFQDLFVLGQADARLLSMTDAEIHNRQITRMAGAFSKPVDPSRLLEKSTIKLCGRATMLWREDNPQALQRSVELFQQLCPNYEITFGKSILSD